MAPLAFSERHEHVAGSVPRRPLSWRKKLLFIGVLCLLPALVVAAIAEVWIRLNREYVTPDVIRARAPRYDPAVFARHVFSREPWVVNYGESEVPINSLGYRGPEFLPAKPAGTTRIIVYGGSAVFDGRATQDTDWPHRIERMLRADGFPEVEVINAGIPGHASFDCLGRLFAEGHAFEPDYVLFYSQWNDIKELHATEPLLRRIAPYVPDRDPRTSYVNGLDRALSNASQLYMRLRMNYYNWKLALGSEGAAREGERLTGPTGAALRQYRLDVQLFVDAALAIGAVPVLITEVRLAVPGLSAEQQERIAYEYVRFTPEGLLRAYAETDTILRDVAREKDVTLIDAARELSGSGDIVYDHVHLTERGSQELARIVAAGLRPLLERSRLDARAR